MNHLKNPCYIFGAIILFILAFAFFWFEWRPLQLTKACQAWSMDRMKSIQGGDRVDAKYFFEKCLRENGIR
jgi:preprotein translocase subunit YajC